jgi:alkylation response protein AidB-like acyl-CoA dehydrogenase
MWRLTDEQEALRAEIQGVVRERIQPRVKDISEGCEYPFDLYDVMREANLLGLAIPPEYGGRCSTDVSWCAYVEELAKVSGTVSLMAAYVKLVSLPILLAGSEEQKHRLIPPLVRGERLGSFALSEPSVGSDPGGLETRAERRGDGWILNGEKRFIGNAGLSDDYIVFARTGGPGTKGSRPSSSTALGRAYGQEAADDGLAVADSALALREVEIRPRTCSEVGRRLQDRDGGFDHSRPTCAARAVGLAVGAIELATDYAMRRHAFGKPLLDHQGLSSSSPTWRPTRRRRGR